MADFNEALYGHCCREKGLIIMENTANHPLLQAVEQAVRAKVEPKFMNAFQRIIQGGMKVLYSPKTHDFVAKQLDQKESVEHIAGEGTVKIVAVLYKESKGTMPMEASIPAAQILLCEVLDFMAKAGRATITDELIAESTRVMIQMLLQAFGYTKEQIAEYMRAGAQHMQEKEQAKPAPRGIVASTRAGA